MSMEHTTRVSPFAPPAHPRTVLVLGGGGMKGTAHIGVWKALEEAGVRVDAIMGTSIGALIGACLAGGWGWRELAKVARSLTKDDIVSINRRAVFMGGVREEAVFDGEHYRGWIRRSLPVRTFAEMRLPFRLNTVSLVSGREVWFGTDARGDVPVADAVYASCAIPIYFPPLKLNGDFLVDGGVLDVLPVRRAAEWGAERIIAVDVGSEMLPPAADFFDRGMIAIHDRVLALNLNEQRRRCLEGWDGPPMLYIRPKIGHLGGWDFDRTQFFLEEGYRAAREALKAAAEAA
ncbi:MAG TPA: patatin-like phospholipase family protein [Longimicrobiaceae bacterium]|nr:patatin-like phospholipase family protein [Longimicrobiaceae bacterium]